MPTEPAIPTQIRPVRGLNAAAYTFVADDAGGIVINSNTTSDTVYTIPPDSQVDFPIGTEIKILDNTPRITFVQSGAGVSLFFNDVTTGTAPATIVGPNQGRTYREPPAVKRGGLGARSRITGAHTLTRIIKVGPNLWSHFPN